MEKQYTVVAERNADHKHIALTVFVHKVNI